MGNLHKEIFIENTATVSKEMKAVKDTLDQTDLIDIFIINWRIIT